MVEGWVGGFIRHVQNSQSVFSKGIFFVHWYLWIVLALSASEDLGNKEQGGVLILFSCVY